MGSADPEATRQAVSNAMARSDLPEASSGGGDDLGGQREPRERAVASDGPTARAVWACGWVEEVMECLTDCLSRKRIPRSAANCDFQMTRGVTGCSN